MRRSASCARPSTRARDCRVEPEHCSGRPAQALTQSRERTTAGGGAVFLGLAKRRLPRIRPSFLEQTQVAALRFDFVRRTLELSQRERHVRALVLQGASSSAISGAWAASYEGANSKLDRIFIQ